MAQKPIQDQTNLALNLSENCVCLSKLINPLSLKFIMFVDDDDNNNTHLSEMLQKSYIRKAMSLFHYLLNN